MYFFLIVTLSTYSKYYYFHFTDKGTKKPFKGSLVMLVYISKLSFCYFHLNIVCHEVQLQNRKKKIILELYGTLSNPVAAFK